MKVLDLIKNIDAKLIGENVEVTGLELDNRKIKPGYAFFCIVGYVTDGHKFAKQAVDNGASVLFVERQLDLDVSQVIVQDARYTMSIVAANFYNNPSKNKNIIGITGTNGKTTIAHIVNHVLGDSTVIGTNGIEVEGKKFDYIGRTTPEAFQLQKLFTELPTKNVIMEVSSHALCLYRVLGTKFKVTAFTNLTQDHLDYHKDMEDYFEAKATLFSSKYPAKRVICIDDKWGKILYERCRNQGDDIITVGLSDEADFNPSNVDVDFPLVGKFNQQNMLVAYGICKFMCVDNIEEKLATTPYVEGRMQQVVNNVFVDYAHTPDALKNAIVTLKDIGNGQIITVFGCGGDRDKDKRSKMGKVSETYSDYTIITSDNPRTEEVEDIINDIKKGINKNYIIIPDRRDAIKYSLNFKNDDDIVLIAGKGHEKTQEIKGKTYPFDDCEVILNEVEC